MLSLARAVQPATCVRSETDVLPHVTLPHVLPPQEDDKHHDHHDHDHHHHAEEHAEHKDGGAAANGAPHAHAHHHHKHDSRVSSVGIVADGSADMRKLNAWLSTLLQVRSPARRGNARRHQQRRHGCVRQQRRRVACVASSLRAMRAAWLAAGAWFRPLPLQGHPQHRRLG